MGGYINEAAASTNEGKRGVLREEMLEAAGGAMRFETLAKKVFRHGPTATMVRQLLFWDGRGHDKNGFVYKTYREWWDEEGLTRTELDTARRKLGEEGFGVLAEECRGVPCKLYYRLDLERLREVMFRELDPPTPLDPVPEEQTLNYYSRVQGSCKQVCGIPADKFAGLAPSQYREHQEITSKNSPRGASAPQGGLESPKSVGPPKTSPPPPADGTPPRKASTRDDTTPSVKKEVTRLIASRVISEDEGDKYGGLLAALVREKGVEADELRATTTRWIERRKEGARLKLQQALEDVRSGNVGGARGAGGRPSPPEAIEALRTYDNDGGRDLRRFADLAGRFDFSGDAEPGRGIRQELGGTYEEQERYLKRLRSVCKRAVREERDRQAKEERAADRVRQLREAGLLDENPPSGARRASSDPGDPAEGYTAPEAPDVPSAAPTFPPDRG